MREDDTGIMRCEDYDHGSRFKCSTLTNDTGTFEEWQRDERGEGDSCIPRYVHVGEYRVNQAETWHVR